jgi:hypothetical protein
MKRIANLLAAFALCSGIALAAGTSKLSYKPEVGYVPDEETAIAIAVAVWSPIYGKNAIEKDKPFRARLSEGVWTVKGTLPKGQKGGVAEADIAKDDGRILRVIRLR